MCGRLWSRSGRATVSLRDRSSGGTGAGWLGMLSPHGLTGADLPGAPAKESSVERATSSFFQNPQFSKPEDFVRFKCSRPQMGTGDGGSSTRNMGTRAPWHPEEWRAGGYTYFVTSATVKPCAWMCL